MADFLRDLQLQSRRSGRGVGLGRYGVHGTCVCVAHVSTGCASGGLKTAAPWRSEVIPLHIKKAPKRPKPN